MSFATTMVAALFSVLAFDPVPQESRETVDLVWMSETYCMAPDGNPQYTRALLERDGFRPLGPEDFPDLRLPGAEYLRGFSKQVGGKTVRVLTNLNVLNGAYYFRTCWVSSSPEERLRVGRELSRFLDLPGFRQDDAFFYGWSFERSGPRRPMSRREFDLNRWSKALEMDQRFVIINDYRHMVSIAYLVPTADQTDPGN